LAAGFAAAADDATSAGAAAVTAAGALAATFAGTTGADACANAVTANRAEITPKANFFIDNSIPLCEIAGNPPAGVCIYNAWIVKPLTSLIKYNTNYFFHELPLIEKFDDKHGTYYKPCGTQQESPMLTYSAPGDCGLPRGP
jgi:hypothetical protein